MASFVKVASVKAVPPGSGLVVTAGGKELALFNVDGEFHAIDNTCAHMGGPLGEGALEGCIVTCPWHGWKFDVTSGRSPAQEVIRVPRYETRVEGDDVLVAV